MTTTTQVPSGSTVNNQNVTSGNTLEVQSGGTADTTTVQNGGMLLIDPGGTENNADILAGGVETVNGTINSSNVPTASGTSNGDTLYGTLNAGSGAVVENATVESGGVLNLTAKSATASNVTVLSGGLMTINGNAPANATALDGGTLELESSKADTTNTTTGVPTASGSLTFASGADSTLRLDVAQSGTNGTTFAQTLSGFAAGDVVDLRYLTDSGASVTQSQSGSSAVVTVTGGGGTGSETFTFANSTAGNFALSPESGGATGTELIVACFASGTAIRTSRGDVAVEALQVGDFAVTASGAARPIRWIGKRTLDCAAHRDPSMVRPFRVAAGAFGGGRPTRDLLLSPHHSVAVTCVGEVLVPIHLLANDTTIAQQSDVEEITYWHVELDSHDVILADGLPAESYLDVGNRCDFEGEDSLKLHPELGSRAGAGHCRPLVTGGTILAAIREQIAVSEPTTPAGSVKSGFHLLVEGERVAPVVRGHHAAFVVPAGTRDVRLVSSTFVPCDLDPVSPDDRRLGVMIRALSVDDLLGNVVDVPLGSPVLVAGIHPLESGPDGTWRWTDGDALLSASLFASTTDPCVLRLTGRFEAPTHVVAPATTRAA